MTVRTQAPLLAARIGEPSVQERKLFIGGLAWEVTDEEVRFYLNAFNGVQHN